ncbi:MAG TPA: 50S ribosomal protein L18 [Myxococcota bacterium]|nr:50S ribosomal protein L18 [Myxococcota bacterium]
MSVNSRKSLLERRKRRVRKQLARSERPMLTVFRSSKHIYAQIVDPISGKTLSGVSTRSPGLRDGLESTKDVEAAKKVGTAIAKLALEKEIKQVSFNRNGFVYTGRVKALADAAREAGLTF